MELPEDTWVDQHRYDRVGEAYGTPSWTACAQLGSAHVLHRPSAVHEIVSLLVKSGTESDLVKLSPNRGGRAEGKARKLTAYSLIIAGIPIVVISAGIFTQRWWLYQDEENSDFIVENALRSINITSGGNFIASVLCSSWASWRARSRNLKESGQTEADSKEIQEKLVIVVGDDNVPGVEEVKTEDSLV